jgi:predicted dehydrogenase
VAIRLIHVGVGVRGRHWLEIVAAHPDFVSVACVDGNPSALDEARKAPGQAHGRFLTSLEQALADVRGDAVLIASPSHLHAPQTLMALEAGLAVMVEKPLAGSVAEAMGVIERGRLAGRPVMVAENYRYYAAERTLRRLLQEEITGPVSSVVCIDRRDQPSHTQGSWVKSAAYPFLTEIAVHHFDSFRFLFDRQPRSIFAISHNPPGSTYDRQAAVHALIAMDGNLPIQYTGTMIANRYEFALWIEGDRGDLWTDRKRVWWRPRGRRWLRPSKLDPVPKGDERPYPWAGTTALLNQFLDAIVEGAVPETVAHDNIWTLAMVEAAVRSDREGRMVRMDEVLPSPPDPLGPRAETPAPRRAQG